MGPLKRFEAIWSQKAEFASRSLLTGESRPVPKHPGDIVIGCSRHVGSRPCRLKATRVGSGSAVAQIVQLVEKAAATATNAPAQRFADAAARIFVPSVVLLAALTALVWFCRLVCRHVSTALAVLVFFC